MTGNNGTTVDQAGDFAVDMCKLLHEQVGTRLLLAGVLNAFTSCNTNLSSEDLTQIAANFSEIVKIVEAQ